jgi:CRISPR-associated DxTHG motif protein
MKLLTFLGVANYQETTYTWQELDFTTRYAPAASTHFLKPDALTVFLTEEAEQKIFPDFRKVFPETLEIIPVPVPLGKDVPELWHIFDQVSGSVRPGESVAFDITHGLRSFPLIGLLAAAFLRRRARRRCST